MAGLIPGTLYLSTSCMNFVARICGSCRGRESGELRDPLRADKMTIVPITKRLVLQLAGQLALPLLPVIILGTPTRTKG